MVAGLALAFLLTVGGTYPFLALNDPIPGGILVVEGWAPDYALRAAVAEVATNRYERLFVTGGPLERGAPLSEYRTYAELGAATLARLGASTNLLQPVPAPAVRHDRTYASALSLRNWLQQHPGAFSRINVVTLGPHARRSRLLFQQVFGDNVRVGVIAVPEQEYDCAHWWRSSSGVRTVTGEAIAYAYVRLFFNPVEP